MAADYFSSDLSTFVDNNEYTTRLSAQRLYSLGETDDLKLHFGYDLFEARPSLWFHPHRLRRPESRRGYPI